MQYNLRKSIHPPRSFPLFRSFAVTGLMVVLALGCFADDKVAPKKSSRATPAGARGRQKTPAATAAAALKVMKDFKAELLYSVPKEVQGSWVNLCADPKGRLLVSDQYGPLYRVTPAPLGASAEETKVEKLDLPLGEAHGLLWAFDSLYVMVNEGQKYQRGLHRARSRDGGDTFEKPEFLHAIEGGGEHEPHAVLLGPHGKSLHL